MAAAIPMVVGAVVNAFSFSGASWIFSKFDKGAANEEQTRHDKAIEELDKAKDEYERKRSEFADYTVAQDRREQQANSDFRDAADSLALYGETHPVKKSSQVLGPPPTLEDYYTPSTTIQNIEYALIIGSVIISGYFTYKYIHKRKSNK